MLIFHSSESSDTVKNCKSLLTNLWFRILEVTTKKLNIGMVKNRQFED